MPASTMAYVEATIAYIVRETGFGYQSSANSQGNTLTHCKCDLVRCVIVAVKPGDGYGRRQRIATGEQMQHAEPNQAARVGSTNYESLLGH